MNDLDDNKDKQNTYEKTICSGIPIHRILTYFDLESVKNPQFIEKYQDAEADYTRYRFDTCSITVRSNPSIKLVVPMTDIVFGGEKTEVDLWMEKYRKFFLSAGG